MQCYVSDLPAISGFEPGTTCTLQGTIISAKRKEHPQYPLNAATIVSVELDQAFRGPMYNESLLQAMAERMSLVAPANRTDPSYPFDPETGVINLKFKDFSRDVENTYGPEGLSAQDLVTSLQPGAKYFFTVTPYTYVSGKVKISIGVTFNVQSSNNGQSSMGLISPPL